MGTLEMYSCLLCAINREERSRAGSAPTSFTLLIYACAHAQEGWWEAGKRTRLVLAPT